MAGVLVELLAESVAPALVLHSARLQYCGIMLQWNDCKDPNRALLGHGLSIADLIRYGEGG